MSEISNEQIGKKDKKKSGIKIEKVDKTNKWFDLDILRDIMDKASEFSEIRLVLEKDKITFDIKNRHQLEVINKEISTQIPLKVVNKVVDFPISSEDDIEEITNEQRAIQERSRRESLILSDPDAYFEGIEEGDYK